MVNKIKSLWHVAILLSQRLYDNIHRQLTGLPLLKRSKITANLFLGSQYSPIGLNKLKALGVTGIVNMREHSVYEEAKYEGVKYLHLPTVDNTPPTMETLIQGADFIDQEIKAGGKVYVHCRQGLGRGPTMAMAYLIKTGLTYEDAFHLVKSVRTFIDPRPEQILKLKELEGFYSRMAVT